MTFWEYVQDEKAQDALVKQIGIADKEKMMAVLKDGLKAIDHAIAKHSDTKKGTATMTHLIDSSRNPQTVPGGAFLIESILEIERDQAVQELADQHSLPSEKVEELLISVLPLYLHYYPEDWWEELHRTPSSGPKEKGFPANDGIDDLFDQLNNGGSVVVDGSTRGDGSPASPEPASDGPQQFVSTGFSGAEQADVPWEKNKTLTTNTSFYFWLEISEELVEGAIDDATVTFDPGIIPDAKQVSVVISSFKDHFLVDDQADLGVLQIGDKQRVSVLEQATSKDSIPVGDEKVFDRRLFFPLKTQTREGVYRLLCNIYYENVMIQAREITAVVSAASKEKEDALSSFLTFKLDQVITKDALQKYPKHRLSLLLNDEEEGSHNFQFFGGKHFKNSAHFEGQEISNHLSIIRRALRKVAWGSVEEWQLSTPYRYVDRNDQRMAEDLFRLASEGFRFYDAVFNRLGGNSPSELKELMQEPGHIQLALQTGASSVLPLGLIYDYLLDTGLDLDEYRLCEVFQEAIDKGTPLTETACFHGECPHQEGDGDVVCPSGFWGFRHYLGFPHTVGSGSYAPAEIFYQDKPSFSVGISTDRNFKMRDGHLANLKDMVGDDNYQLASNRKDILRLLRKSDPQVVYFYCHGGYDKGRELPYLEVGDPSAGEIITRDNLQLGIKWPETTPLVFINGCHTTSVSPDQAINFVSGFVETSQAAGVVGTEITIFEPLATAFAEAFFKRFLDGESIGTAIRNSRLDLLQNGNPLGLVYVPFVTTGLQLVQEGAM